MTETWRNLGRPRRRTPLTDAQRARRNLRARQRRTPAGLLAMRRERARAAEAPAFGGFAAICAAVGLPMSAGSTLDPRLWADVPVLYEGLNLAHVKVGNNAHYRTLSDLR